MYKVALTGGIGTGKTYVSRQFIDLGIPVFYADEEAKKLYFEESVIQFLQNEFGKKCFSNDSIDFAKMGSFLFSDVEALKKVEQYIHPLLMQKFETWAVAQNAAIVMMESAIIFEHNLQHYFDKVIVVDAPLSIRINRIQRRNPHLSLDDIHQRIANQMEQEKKCALADLVIDHSEDK